MKFRSLFLGVLAALMISAGFTSCSDDDDDDVINERYFNGEKLEKPQEPKAEEPKEPKAKEKKEKK